MGLAQINGRLFTLSKIDASTHAAYEAVSTVYNINYAASRIQDWGSGCGLGIGSVVLIKLVDN
jgi:hypothetical protein